MDLCHKSTRKLYFGHIGFKNRKLLIYATLLTIKYLRSQSFSHLNKINIVKRYFKLNIDYVS